MANTKVTSFRLPKPTIAALDLIARRLSKRFPEGLAYEATRTDALIWAVSQAVTTKPPASDDEQLEVTRPIPGQTQIPDA